MTSFTNDSCPAGRPLASRLSLSTGKSMLIHRDRHSRRRQRTKLFHLLLSFQLLQPLFVTSKSVTAQGRGPPRTLQEKLKKQVVQTAGGPRSIYSVES
ncbi:hypothetical protein BJX66DRAFT_307530 [Aspergillus keveii]|uniref:Uncharacterized protein n=1 Tax=Aspergillus keveii TaxID=714993 RepID=A0ABR4G0R4_9EURO